MKHTSHKWKSVPSLGALFLLSRRAAFTLLAASCVLTSCKDQRKEGGAASGQAILTTTFSQADASQKDFSETAEETVPAKKTGNARLPELPAPRKGENMIIHHTAYTLSYNKEHNTPNWVAWELTRAETRGNGQRSREFFPDPKLDIRYQVTDDDYRGSHYDRGHMCPAGDNKWDGHAMTECFYLSNMCPQNHEFNSNSWESLESACRRWARKEGSIYIVCGPIYDAHRKQKTIGREHKVSVPNGFFKCVLSLRNGKEKAIGFVYQHNEQYQSMESVATTVDAVEELTGYDFFSSVSKELQNHVEAMCNLTEWD